MTTFRADDAKIRQSILEMLGCAGSKYTPMDLERKVCGQKKVSKKAVRRAVQALMAENRLTYTQFLGHTFVEISYKRPVETGGGVILAPPDAVVHPRPKQIVVRIEAGAAFGAGDHPTTRMALKLAAWTFHDHILPKPAQNCRVLDIGTGSGVLAAAACLMGAARAAGTDIDPCARAEAAQNAALNGLTNRMEIFDSIASLEKNSPGLPPFHLVLANLRYPTLVRMHKAVTEISAPGAVIIFSGFRPHEQPDLLKTYGAAGVDRLRTLEENGWCAATIQKRP